eukprot:918760-Rhodomonas_salina.1
MTSACCKSADAMLLLPELSELQLTARAMTLASERMRMRCFCFQIDQNFNSLLIRTSIHGVRNDISVLQERGCDASTSRAIRTSTHGAHNDTRI